ALAACARCVFIADARSVVYDNPVDLANSGQGPMSAIAAAVTPVVMISANAILVSSIGSKHQAMSDRVRALTAEWRDPGTPLERRRSIRAQVLLFQDRLNWIS